ncbi:hypothetical protein KXD40_001642 [Peronospora effusa]|uniref:RING-type domain-containing protein n=1 Tax=Peronospora effusa TaxID=542832 RepID=A0A3M6VIY0_9STRA|nr:hypothetical protein DD238_006048 [Peronospora effusa]UIZ26279.1 hypothetical protein KXD40_001642 [Peronospora effusa]CAI5712616.1 unnamed protein product [Peronospora effusa]
MASLILLITSGLSVLVAFIAVSFPQTFVSLAVSFSLPVVIYGIISLVELVILNTKRGWTQDQQHRHREAHPGVVSISRALYEQLDGDMLQLLMSNRDFVGNDDERLMRRYGRRNEGATPQQIQQLPTVTVTKGMLQTSENENCIVCLRAFQVDDRVRMMPCFHRFHLECIDPWLKEKASCPICKFSTIT